MLDEAMALRIAIEFHIVVKATDYIENESGLIQSERGADRKATLFGEVRKRYRNLFITLRKMGVLDSVSGTRFDRRGRGENH